MLNLEKRLVLTDPGLRYAGCLYNQGYTFSAHRHSEWQLIAVIREKFRFNIEGTAVNIASGGCVLLAP